MRKTIKEILGYPNYKIRDDGNVFNNKTGRKLVNNLASNGYYTVTLCNKGKRKTHYIHQLVGRYFCLNGFSLPEINHINGDKLDNYHSNLEWCTSSQNQQHAVDTGLQKKQTSKMVALEGTGLKTGKVISFESYWTASVNGFNDSHLRACIKGERKTHKGYTWRLLNDKK